jgi:hypothetical protein
LKIGITTRELGRIFSNESFLVRAVIPRPIVVVTRPIILSTCKSKRIAAVGSGDPFLSKRTVVIAGLNIAILNDA